MENNFWRKLKAKGNKTTYDLSKETNISEEKLNEVFNGDRELPTNHVDKVYTALKEKKQPMTSIERALIEKFFIDNDILVLRKSWGYKSMQSLADAIGVGVSNLYYLRPQYIKKLTDNFLQKVYDFFQDELNKNVVKNKRNVIKPTYNKLKKEDVPKEILDWYNNFDLRAWRKNKKLTAKQLCEKIGFNKGYETVYLDYENHKEGKRTGNWLIIQRLYDYINKDKNPIVKPIEIPVIKEEPKPVDTYVKVNGIELPKCAEITTTDIKKPMVVKLEYPTIEKEADYKQLYEETLKELNRYKKLIDMIK